MEKNKEEEKNLNKDKRAPHGENFSILYHITCLIKYVIIIN